MMCLIEEPSIYRPQMTGRHRISSVMLVLTALGREHENIIGHECMFNFIQSKIVFTNFILIYITNS